MIITISHTHKERIKEKANEKRERKRKTEKKKKKIRKKKNVQAHWKIENVRLRKECFAITRGNQLLILYPALKQ